MYNPILTDIGKTKIANAIANNTTVDITEMAVGDSNGIPYQPTEDQTALVNEVYRVGLSSLTINPLNPSLIEMIGIIPADVGGFTIREVGIFDIDGDMIAVSEHPAFDKFILDSSASSLEIKFMIAVTNTSVVNLIIQEDVYASAESVESIQKALKDSEFPNGFPNRIDSKISFDEASKTFTIEPTVDEYDFYIEGIEFTKNEPSSVTIDDINGLWYIYFDENGVLQSSQTSFFNVGASAFVAYIYWNSTQQRAVIFGDERHGLQMTKSTHSYLHNFEGARFRSGLVAGDFTVAGDGTSNSDAQLSLTNGAIQDEDIIHNITHSDTPSNDYEQFLTPYIKAPTHFRDGINGIWTVEDATDYPINLNSGIPQYNLKTTSWDLADVPDKNFYAVWIVATNNIHEPIISVVGQRVDSTLDLAEANNKFEDLDFGETSLLEFKQLYRLIYEYDSSFTNDTKSALRGILDIRGVTVRQISGTTTINHNELTGRNEANTHPISAITGLSGALSELFVKPLSRYNKSLFTKVNPHSISIPSGFKVAVNNKVINVTSDYILSLDSNLDTGIKTAGKDYYVYAKDDETFYLSANNSITVDKLIGGFHYGLTPENEVRPANALRTEADMIANRGIKAYSMWDLTWKPASIRPEGKVLVNNLFWRDIYPADEDYGIRGYSSCFALDGVTPAKIAGGAETNGRKFPKIPLSKGGNGTLNYGSLTWYEANEIINEVGMRMISYDEFSNSSYGVVEEKSLSQLGYPTGTGIIQHYPELESKWGVEMAVGVQWTWTKELMNGYGTTDFAARTGLTDGRGYIYATSNSPVAGLAGGQEQHDSTNPVGSRALALADYVWVTHWYNGFVAVCDHMNLDK